MTDFRALCAELVEKLDELNCHYNVPSQSAMIDRARAALADGPAVPDGREPASVTGQPNDEELLETLDKATATFPPRHPEAEGLNAVEYPLALELRKARAVLARWGNPAPLPPAEGEVEELVVELRMMASQAAEACQFTDAENLSRAADLLEQHHPAPVPVPVSERLPAMVTDGLRVAGDCDEQGRCWLFSKVEKEWRLIDAGNPGVPHLKYCFSHWLPAHALPLPSGEVE